MAARRVEKGRPVHEAERRGLDALVRALPEDYTVFTNIDLPGNRLGQSYEHDAVVVAPHAVFTVELKSWGGRIVGNRDRWTLQDGFVVPSPIPLALHKARVLKGQLKSKRLDLGPVWVQPVVFLTSSDAHAHISEDFADYVVTTAELKQTFTDPGWLGGPVPLSAAQREAILKVINDGQPVARREELGGFRLLQRLPAEDRPFVAWRAERLDQLRRATYVLHVYSLDGEPQERERRRAHALREATLCERLRGLPDILRYYNHSVTYDDPQRVILEFEDTTPLIPLSAWVRDRAPGLTARLGVAARLARALEQLHARRLVHRRLCADAVLVSNEDSPSELRLCAMELARDLTAGAMTVTIGAMHDQSARYAAPELLRVGESTPRADLFSLGAVFVELFSGRPAFGSSDEILRPYTLPSLLVAGRPCPAPLVALVEELLRVKPEERPASAEEVAERISALSRSNEQPAPSRALAPGVEVRELYALERRLGFGATATTWLARHLQTGQAVVLKIAKQVDGCDILRHEAKVYECLRHPNLARLNNIEPLDGGRVMLVMEYVEGVTAAEWAGAGDPLTPEQLWTVAEGLTGALGELHQRGWVHRDVKPENIVLRVNDATPKLLDLGLARPLDYAEGLFEGSHAYKDPLVVEAGCWTPANDQYALWLVLWELLTGAHPFEGAAPGLGGRLNLAAEDLSESFPAAAAERLVALFSRALSPALSDRPPDLTAALGALGEALGLHGTGAERPARAPRANSPKPSLPDPAPLDAPIQSLGLSARGQGALARLGFGTLGELVGQPLRERARELANVGAKTLQELRALEELLALRFPDTPQAAPRADRLYPPLAEDPRALDRLGGALTSKVKAALTERGMTTIGDLAGMATSAVRALPGVGERRLAELRLALRRAAGREERPEHLDELSERLKAELGERRYEQLAAVVGLQDGVSRGISEVAAALGISRQAVSQAADLSDLRAAGSAAWQLVSVVQELMPPVGFVSLSRLAEALAEQLPPGACSALGWARLGALLLRPDARGGEATSITHALREPWTLDELDTLRGQLSEQVGWPPRPRAEVERRMWEALPEAVTRRLAIEGADAASLLDALLKEQDAVLLDRLGRLYQPPVRLADALGALRPSLPPILDVQTLVERAHEAFLGVVIPDRPQELHLALAAAGYRLRDGQAQDVHRVEQQPAVAQPVVDESIPTQALGETVPPLVASLVSQRLRGGFRVVLLPPATHPRWSRQLAGWLSEATSPALVTRIDVDRALLNALKEHDLWKFVPYMEAEPDVDWRFFHDELKQALNAALAEAAPGRVTVLSNPALLGTLGLMDWLSGLYDRARGGRLGLVVLAMPGGLHQDRVRLNERYSLPYTPDMAAVQLVQG